MDYAHTLLSKRWTRMPMARNQLTYPYFRSSSGADIGLDGSFKVKGAPSSSVPK